MLALAAGLRKEGWTVHVGLSEPYAHLVSEIDCIPHIMVSNDQFQEMIVNEDLWKPLRGTHIVFNHAVPHFARAWFRRIQELSPPPGSLFVAHPLDMASCIYRLAHPNVRLVHVHLAPSTLLNPNDPPKFTSLRYELRRPAWLVDALLWLGDRVVIRTATDSVLRELHSELRLNYRPRRLRQWWHVGDLWLGLFPDWFGPNPKNEPLLNMSGFPFNDGVAVEADTQRARELTHGWQRRPILFTPGTAHIHARPYFEMAVKVCETLGHPGILASSHRDQFPSDLPDLVRTVGYIPFSALLPECQAIVHHGGIGTTSQAFLAGVPQLVVPMGFDQFDNADRVQKVGCGHVCPMKKLTVRRMTRLLSEILSQPSFTERSRQYALRCERGACVTRCVQLMNSLY